MNTEPYQTVDDVKSNGIFLCELSEGLSRMLTLPFDGQDDDPDYCWAQLFASTNILFLFLELSGMHCALLREGEVD